MKRFLASTLLAFLPLLPVAGHATSVTSITTSCPASGPAVGVVTLANGLAVIAETGSYTSTLADCGNGVAFSISVPATHTLPAPVAGFTLPLVANCGSGTPSDPTCPAASTAPVTLVPPPGVKIDGLASETFQPGDIKGVWSNGSNYFTTGGQAQASQFTPGYSASVWYLPANYGYIAGTGAPLASANLYCTPAWINDVSAKGGGSATLASLAARIMTAGSSNVQLAIYANDATASPYRPGALLGHTGNIADTSAGTITAALTSGASVGPGLYWMCAEANDTTAKLESFPVSSTANSFYAAAVGSTNAGSVLSSVLGAVSTASGGFGTWPPNLHGSAFLETTASAVVAFQFSSIP